MFWIILRCWVLPLLGVVAGVVAAVTAYVRIPRARRPGGKSTLDSDVEFEVTRSGLKYKGPLRGLVVSIGAAVAAISFIILATADCKHESAAATPNPPASNTFISVTVNVTLMAPVVWKTASVEGVDKDGKRMEVVIGVLWDPYRWVINSEERVGIVKDRSELIDDVFSGFDPDESRPLIVVGTASHENADDDLKGEVARAGRRADKLIALCQTRFSKKPELYSLNLGAFRQTGASVEESATERRVIVLVVINRDGGFDMDSGLRDALIKGAQKEDFEFDPTGYSNFAPDKFQVKRRSPNAQ